MKSITIKITFVGALILITAFGYSWFTTVAGRTDYRASDEEEPTVQEGMPGMTEAGMGMMDYQDGTYITTVNYEIPYGYVEPMEVTLQLENNTIKDVAASFAIVNPVSEGYQQTFLGYVSREVVGRKVDNVSLSRMTGASLTNQAFDAALAEIKAEAAGMPTMGGDGVVPIQLPGMSDREKRKLNDV